MATGKETFRRQAARGAWARASRTAARAPKPRWPGAFFAGLRTRDLARAVRSATISVVSIQTGSYVAQLTDEASKQLRGRLLAARLESLSDQFADVEVGAIIRLDEADKRPLLNVVEVWVGGTGEEELSSTGILQLRDGLRIDLGEGS